MALCLDDESFFCLCIKVWNNFNRLLIRTFFFFSPSPDVLFSLCTRLPVLHAVRCSPFSMFSKLLHLLGPLPHCCNCWDLLDWRGPKGPCSRRFTSGPFSMNAHSSSPPSAASEAGIWACESFPTVQRRPVVQTGCRFELSGPVRSLILKPQPCCCCWGVSITPVAWNTLDQLADLCQCCNLGLSFSHLSGREPRLAQQGQNPTKGETKQKAQKKLKTLMENMFSRMFESCQMSVHFFFPRLKNVLGKYLWHWHPPWVGAPSDVERSIQCQGDESLAVELIISITHGHMAVSCPLPPQNDCQVHDPVRRWADMSASPKPGARLQQR